MLPAYFDLTTSSPDPAAARAEFKNKVAALPQMKAAELIAADFVRNADIMQSHERRIRDFGPAYYKEFDVKHAIASSAALTGIYYSSQPVICSSAFVRLCDLNPDTAFFKGRDLGRDIGFNAQYGYPSAKTRYDFIAIREGEERYVFPALFIDQKLLAQLAQKGLKESFSQAMSTLLLAGHDYLHSYQTMHHYLPEVEARLGGPEYSAALSLHDALAGSPSARPDSYVPEEPVVFTLNYRAFKALPRTSNRLTRICDAATKVFSILATVETPENRPLVDECRQLATMMVSNLVHRHELENAPVSNWKHVIQEGTTTLHDTVPLGYLQMSPEEFTFRMYHSLRIDAELAHYEKPVQKLMDEVQAELAKYNSRGPAR